MHAWIRRYSGEVLLAGLLFGQILMVGLQTRIDGQSRLRYWTGGVLLPVQRAAQALTNGLGSTWDRYLWLVGTEEENRRLDGEADRLRIENYFLRRELLRATSRAELDAFAARASAETLTASVVASSPSRSVKEVHIDRGRRDGVAAGMAVATADGIVGKIAAAFGSSSTVLLISDAESGAGAVLGGSGEPAVLRGNGDGTCRLDYVAPHVSVEPGESVFTSGLDGVYPLGLPVGHVAHVETLGQTQAVMVRPAAPLDRLDEVLVFLSPKYELLPDDLRLSFSAVPGGGWTAREGDSALVEPTGIDADQVKRAFRRTVDSQGRTVGQLTYSGPPDFSYALEPQPEARAEQTEEEPR